MSTEVPNPANSSALVQSLLCLRGQTPSSLAPLERLGLFTVGDLLFHFPRRYEDFTDLRSIKDLREEQPATARGEVVEIAGRHSANGRPIVSVVICDDGKTCLEGVWFNQPNAARRFRYGQWVTFSGNPRWFRDHWQMATPRVEILDGAQTVETPGVIPVYPLTEDLRPERLRRMLREAVEKFAGCVVEVLPEEVRRLHRLPQVSEALRAVHLPANLEEAETARQRFVYEEFLLLQLALALRRRDLRDRQRAPRLPVTPEIDARIRRLFPFALTADQDQVIADVCRDLAGDRPMQRLLQADVGAGKTAVAVYALLVAVANRHQAVLMAPTEVLVQQHWQTLEGYLANSRVRRLLLTGSLSRRDRQAALVAIRSGKVDLVVGTQALVQEDVQFASLGVVVIDEQHKFGVQQRARMRRMGIDPHYLVMTATPIPRTQALTVFGDLDVSVIRQLPPGRQPVETRWVAPGQRERVHRRLLLEIQKGRQAFVVCPLVEESKGLDVKAAEQMYEELRQGPFRDCRVGLVHGRMEDADKAATMQRFRAREIDLLVCTVVVEVGVDVPNATLLVIEQAERFGLSQLHQLRGRVSRGSVAGLCYLIAEPTTEEARARLKACVRIKDGFALAEEDARLRGGGQLFGSRQHGEGELRFADLSRDVRLLQHARKDAFDLVLADAGLRQPVHALLRDAVLQKYGKTLDLAEVG